MPMYSICQEAGSAWNENLESLQADRKQVPPFMSWPKCLCVKASGRPSPHTDHAKDTWRASTYSIWKQIEARGETVHMESSCSRQTRCRRRSAARLLEYSLVQYWVLPTDGRGDWLVNHTRSCEILAWSHNLSTYTGQWTHDFEVIFCKLMIVHARCWNFGLLIHGFVRQLAKKKTFHAFFRMHLHVVAPKFELSFANILHFALGFRVRSCDLSK